MKTPAQLYVEKLRSPWQLRLFLWLKLPSLAFWGLKLDTLDSQKAVVYLQHKWKNQNPFHSIYFAALAGSAEFSTGILCQQHLQGRGDWSMLVKKSEANFTKKATGKISFTCNQGQLVQQCLDQIEKSTDRQGELTLTSIATNEAGDTVGEFVYHWTFKMRHNSPTT